MKLFNQQSIKSKLILLTATGVILLSLFLLVNRLYLNHQRQLDEQSLFFNQLKYEYAQLHDKQSTYLTELINNNDLLFLSISSHLQEINKSTTQCLFLIDSISTFHFLVKDTVIQDKIKLYERNIKELSNQYEDLIIFFRERGTVSQNLLKQLTDLGDQLEQIITETEDIELLREISGLRKSEKNYLLFMTEDLLNEINTRIETIQVLVEFKYPELTYKTNQLYSNYQKTIKQIGKINQQMGIGLNTGLRHKMKVTSNTLEDVYKEITAGAQDKIDFLKKRIKIIFFVIYFILIGFFCVLLYLTGQSVIRPLIIVKQYTERIKKGELPEPLKLNIKGEIKDVVNNINELIQSLKVKKDFALELGNDNFNAQLDLLSKKDILTKALLNLQNNLISANKEHEKHVQDNKIRRYINEGLAKFGDLMRIHSNDIDKLSDEFIKELVRYLQAIQGGLFLLAEGDKKEQYLELKGAFAYNRKKYIERKILFGEGLVGTCAVEKKSIIPKNIPDDYIQISSGLGDSKPNNLVLMPVLYEENIQGVIEIAGLHAFKDHEVQFLTELANSLGAALNSIKINAKTSELLKKSQQQAAEMAEQEEEMRQNMEELQATQEEASRRENETNSMINAYDSSSLTMEYALDGTVTDINNNYALFLDTKPEIIVGKTRAGIFGYDKDKDTYKNFWELLAKGEKQFLTEIYTDTDGNKKWIQQRYVPVINNDGKVFKILNIAIDITESKLRESEIDSREMELKGELYEASIVKSLLNQSLIKAAFNTDGILLEANKNFFDSMELNAEEVIDKHYNTFLAKAGTEKFDNIWDSLINTKKSLSTLYRRTKPNGKFIWLSSTFTPIIENNDITKIIMLSNDITDNIQRIIR